MTGPAEQRLPPGPVLRAYVEAGVPNTEELARLPGLGPRFQAVLGARAGLLSERFLDQAAEADFRSALGRFYEACVPGALHAESLRRHAGIVRHALGHLLRCRDPLPLKAQRCLRAGGPYHVAGLGPAFWSALFQGLDPLTHPAWTPAVELGLRRLGLARRGAAGPGQVYAAFVAAYARLRTLEPSLTALHLDHFLNLVAGMKGRSLWSGSAEVERAGGALAEVIRRERTMTPLRLRLKERGEALHHSRQEIEAGLAAGDACRIGAALGAALPAGAPPLAGSWSAHAPAVALWVGRLWAAEDPYEVLEDFWRADPVPGGGLWLPTAVLHLKDPGRFFPWGEAPRRAYEALDEACDPGTPPAEGYRLFNEGLARLRDRHRLHPLELPGLLSALAEWPPAAAASLESARFGGFCADTFRFLADLGRNNRRGWMDQNRDRYRFAVREPLVELCRVLADRYVLPVLCGEHGWDLETVPRGGRALTRICRNDYGQSDPYHNALWITFYHRGAGGRCKEAQLFVRLDRTGLSYGLRLTRAARETAARFRHNVQRYARPLFEALSAAGALEECRFGDADDPDRLAALAGPEDLKTWAAGKGLLACKKVPAEAALSTSEDLAGDILLTFDRLLPAFVCAAEPEPLPRLERRLGVAGEGTSYTDADFRRGTFLGEDWLGKARALLDLKRQLILQGVPGTGKTHVARCLARLLTRGREERVRLVQFHPAYSYEEFVEGIKVHSVEVAGRHEVTYPVEDGLLCAFAAEAARRPAEPHVLIIDEINRGNLPRVFGELLYLLEYRDQSVGLPYSKRSFRLPANLYLVGTMNAADRSVALVDQALRRRFSFLDMPPDAAVLAAWLRANPPAAGPAFAETVVGLFERLNGRLRSELGPPFQVGHSYFMVPDLDEDRLRVVWEHHVQPLLEEYLAGRPGRAGFELDDLLGLPRRKARSPAGVPG